MVVVLLVAGGASWESPALSTLSARSDVVVLKRCVDVDDLLATASSGQAEVAVLGLDAHGLDGPAVDHLRRHGVRPVLVAPGGDLGVDAGRTRAARLGVRSLVPDDDPTALVEAVTTSESDVPAPEADPEPAGIQPAPLGGRVVAVWGPLGAPGRTTVATGFAAELARRRSSTVLVDADPHGGSVAQVLGILDEVSGLLAAGRLGADLGAGFDSVRRSLGPCLTVVTGLPRPDRWTELRPGTVETLLEVAAEHGHVVVDAGFGLEDDPAVDHGARPGRHHVTRSALSVADEVLVVGTPDPVGLSRLARALVELRETAGSVPARVVVNRMRPSLGWSERDVIDMVTGFARPVGLHFLPEDGLTVDRALVTGRTLADTDPDSPLVRAIAALTDAVVPDSGPAPQRGGWPGRLRRRTAG